MARKEKSIRENKQAYRTRVALSRKRGAAKNVRKAQTQKEIIIHKIGVEGKRVTYRVPNREWLKIIERDDALYEKYARPLEAEHKGEFVAIGLNGELIQKRYLNEALAAAVERFGNENFALKRVGYDALMTIR